jgi:hypothetical protein
MWVGCINLFRYKIRPITLCCGAFRTHSGLNHDKTNENRHLLEWNCRGSLPVVTGFEKVHSTAYCTNYEQFPWQFIGVLEAGL